MLFPNKFWRQPNMEVVPSLLGLIFLFWLDFGQSYVLLSQFREGYRGKCSLEPEVLDPPLPKLSAKSMEPGEVIGVNYDENKEHCNKVSCSVWKNHKGEGYRLECLGCAVITKRPSNCSLYTEPDNRLPWPECCYHSKCPRRRDEL